MNSKVLNYLLLAVAVICCAICVFLIPTGKIASAGLPMVISLIAMAFYSKSIQVLKGSSFTFWVFAFLAAAMYYPFLFTNWGFNTQKIVVPLIQLIMFGMGTKLSLGDFWKEFKKPAPILIGTTLIFTIMPLAGVLIAKGFNFPPEIAAGVILIGACPSGAASNVMTYLANGNVALSVSITTFGTLIAPLATPLLMKIFAGKLIDVNIADMMMSTLNMILIPITAGLIVNKLLRNRKKVMDKILPKLSMFAILFYVTIVVAHYRDKLLVVGFALILASIIHNFIGYIFGYGAAKMLRLKERDCRSLAFEVGLKNGGLGTGLALDALHSPDAALAPVIFGKWMNISGSTLANYWRQKKVTDDPENKE
jgi:BASS family bile acid:Na+ symporter